MGLADKDYSVQSINKHEDVLWFDDLGCYIEYTKGADWQKFEGNSAVTWVRDCETDKWLRVEDAWYRFGDRTPMGYGYGALENKNDSTFDYKTTVKRIADGVTMRQSFIKKKKLMMKEHKH